MRVHTYMVAGVHYATLKVAGVPGGYVGVGATVQDAIKSAFRRWNACR